MFSEETETGETNVEHMWMNEIGFDGDRVTGYLINEPNTLKNVQVGDFIDIPLLKSATGFLPLLQV
jgi:uncharacterized protein YegJ (DUF2314 family)